MNPSVSFPTCPSIVCFGLFSVFVRVLSTFQFWKASIDTKTHKEIGFVIDTPLCDVCRGPGSSAIAQQPNPKLLFNSHHSSTNTHHTPSAASNRQQKQPDSALMEGISLEAQARTRSVQGYRAARGIPPSTIIVVTGAACCDAMHVGGGGFLTVLYLCATSVVLVCCCPAICLAAATGATLDIRQVTGANPLNLAQAAAAAASKRLSQRVLLNRPSLQGQASVGECVTQRAQQLCAECSAPAQPLNMACVGMVWCDRKRQMRLRMRHTSDCGR